MQVRCKLGGMGITMKTQTRPAKAVDADRKRKQKAELAVEQVEDRKAVDAERKRVARAKRAASGKPPPTRPRPAKAVDSQRKREQRAEQVKPVRIPSACKSHMAKTRPGKFICSPRT